jgi:hypothetical protein
MLNYLEIYKRYILKIEDKSQKEVKDISDNCIFLMEETQFNGSKKNRYEKYGFSEFIKGLWGWVFGLFA